jgi:hypothetical protein
MNDTTVQGPFFSAVTIDILLLSFLIESDHNDLAKVLFVRLPSVQQPKVVALSYRQLCVLGGTVDCGAGSALPGSERRGALDSRAPLH